MKRGGVKILDINTQRSFCFVFKLSIQGDNWFTLQVPKMVPRLDWAGAMSTGQGLHLVSGTR